MIASEPVLLIDDDIRTIIVSDIHVGFEAAMSARGVMLDSRDSAREMADDIVKLCKANNAKQIILLGDTKDGTSRIAGAEWDAVPTFLEKLAACAPTILVPGNHDAGITKLIPDNVSVSASSGIVLGDTLFTHGHVMPSENLSSISRIVMGHVHPTLRDDTSVIGGQRVWASMLVKKDTIFASSHGRLEITIMPSFNRYIVAHSNRRSHDTRSPILARARNAVISAKIVTLDGAIIGDASLLDSVI